MSVFNDKFRKARRDYSPYLFLFINGQDYDLKGTMYKILDELKLKSKNDYICLSASPLTSIGRFFETTVNGTGKPMYQIWYRFLPGCSSSRFWCKKCYLL